MKEKHFDNGLDALAEGLAEKAKQEEKEAARKEDEQMEEAQGVIVETQQRKLEDVIGRGG